MPALSESFTYFHVGSLAPAEPGSCPAVVGSSLPREFLLSWARNFTVLVRAVQDTFSPCSPTLIYHTAPIPRITDWMVGTLVTPHLGTKHIMHQVNFICGL